MRKRGSRWGYRWIQCGPRRSRGVELTSGDARFRRLRVDPFAGSRPGASVLRRDTWPAAGRERTVRVLGREYVASASGSPSGSGGSGRRRRTVTLRSTSRTSPRNGQSLRPRASSSLARPSTRAFVIWRSSPIPMATTACSTAGTRREPDAALRRGAISLLEYNRAAIWK
jgi:hypothetical protein